jgi:H+/Cl- antiporter ClcA
MHSRTSSSRYLSTGCGGPRSGVLAWALEVFSFREDLGVGYDNIAELLHGSAPIALILGILLAKSLMWAFSLGSGTSGGVLAPLLMIGGAAGALAGRLGHAPSEMQAFWALIGMGAMLAGSLGVPLTAILFSLEVTHCLPAIGAAYAGLHRLLSRDSASYAALDPHRKVEPPWIPPHARVRRRPTRDRDGCRFHVPELRT